MPSSVESSSYPGHRFARPTYARARRWYWEASARTGGPRSTTRDTSSGATSSSWTSSPARAPRRARTRLVRSTVRLVPVGGQPTAIAGLGSYLGQIKLTAASDGIVVVNRLALERYLLGLAEVPPDWPAEALKAQAIAARTYALNTLDRPPAGAAATYGFDICASVECQVFTGAEILQQSDGQRWADAVGATAGEAILYEGRPILARYHSCLLYTSPSP